jgi:hypothetical protein
VIAAGVEEIERHHGMIAAQHDVRAWARGYWSSVGGFAAS